jgi:Response regulators consisting of a CheY-like receiver domain and a winged-helix DNA-binding domain
MRVLLVEDDQYLRDGLTMALKHKGYNVDGVSVAGDAKLALAQHNYDVVLLDLGLPDMDGTEFLAEMRGEGKTMPVIILTARDSVEDRIAGLDLGANDYMVKPFDPRELEARIRAISRKVKFENQTQVSFGSLTLNTNTGRVLTEGQSEELELTPREAVVLGVLLARPGKVASKRNIKDQVSDWVDDTSENAIEIIVHRLRKKLENSNVVINTVRGFGYVLEERA